MYVDNLWTQHDLEEMVVTKEIVPLPMNIEAKVLQSVVLLLLTGNINATLAAQSYLEPLYVDDDNDNIYQFVTHDGQGKQQNKDVIHYIGKYGSCTAAVRSTLPEFEVHNYASSFSKIASCCFLNLCTIISLGIACGSGKKVKMCDVLVSSKVVNYSKAQNENGEYLQEGNTFTVSPQLVQLFTKLDQWPSDSIKKRLKDNGLLVPNVKLGAILSGPYNFTDPAMKKLIFESTAPDVVGIELKVPHLFAETQQTIENIIIVKSVCDLADGRNHEMYEPTASLMAANLVHECLANPKANEMFES